MRRLLLALALATAPAGCAAPSPSARAGASTRPRDDRCAREAAEDARGPLTPERAYTRLRDGHDSFLAGDIGCDEITPARRDQLTGGQKPFATVLSCSDSRVPPERIFAQGFGHLFTVRVAGNVAEPATVASVEYAAAHLQTPLVVVMGHSNCGGVNAAAKGARETPSMAALVDLMVPAFTGLRPEERAPNAEPAVRANVHHTAEELLKQSALLRDLVAKKQVRVVEAVYDLQTGKVSFAP